MASRISDELQSAVRKARNRLIDPCQQCEGTGRLGDRHCDCHREYQNVVEFAFAGIPEEYWFHQLQTYPGDLKARKEIEHFIEALEEMREEGLGLCLVGEYGRGKTSLGCEVLKAAVRLDMNSRNDATGTAQYKTLSRILRDLMDNFRRKEPLGGSEYEREMQADVLFIDEIGKEYRRTDNDWSRILFDELLRQRKAEKRITVIATNIPVHKQESGVESMRERYGDSIYSMLRSMLHVVHVAGDDLRKDGEEKYMRIIESRKCKSHLRIPKKGGQS